MTQLWAKRGQAPYNNHSMIKLDEFTFSHASKSDFAVGPLSIEIENHLVITGDNGSGKTTLLKCLAGLLLPRSGTRTCKTEKIAFISSDSPLPWNYLTGAEYIILYNKLLKNNLSKKKMMLFLKKKWPDLCPLLEKKCYTYSSGQKKILQIINHLLSSNKLIIFDEPDAQLDTKNTQIMYELFTNTEFNQNKLILFSSHKMKHNKYNFQTLNIKKGILSND